MFLDRFGKDQRLKVDSFYMVQEGFFVQIFIIKYFLSFEFWLFFVTMKGHKCALVVSNLRQGTMACNVVNISAKNKIYE